MLFVHSPEEAQRAKRRDFLIHFILFLFLFSFFKVPTLSYGAPDLPGFPHCTSTDCTLKIERVVVSCIRKASMKRR